ncbi:MAG TPA: hypothetical protein VK876_03225, partial [Rubrivivax sp.]|nr:hypothetical protein [Rubrivivax sp.]
MDVEGLEWLREVLFKTTSLNHNWRGSFDRITIFFNSKAFHEHKNLCNICSSVAVDRARHRPAA